MIWNKILFFMIFSNSLYSSAFKQSTDVDSSEIKFYNRTFIGLASGAALSIPIFISTKSENLTITSHSVGSTIGVLIAGNKMNENGSIIWTLIGSTVGGCLSSLTLKWCRNKKTDGDAAIIGALSLPFITPVLSSLAYELSDKKLKGLQQQNAKTELSVNKIGRKTFSISYSILF